MPRNGSGTYSLPQAAFVPGTTISSSAVNSDFSDIASALTDSLAADGQTTMTGPIKAGQGTAGAPAYTSTVDTTTGLYFPAAGEMAWAYSGTLGALFNFDSAGGVQFNGAITVGGNATVSGAMTVDGALTANSIAFTGTGAVQIPDGTTAQRPGTPVAGDIRYSSTNSNFEGYDGTEWQVMSGNTAPFTLTASVNTNILTVSVLNTKTGAAPTAADPLAFQFRATAASGDLVTVLATGALSIDTNATGATLGSQSGGVPFRFWIVVFNNGGTLALALWHSGAGAATPSINALNPATLQSSTAISNAATSTGVFYTENGTTVSSKAFQVLGYLDYGNGLTTAGTYASTPTALRSFVPGIRLPGAVVQSQYSTTTTQTTISGTTSKVATALTGNITPSTAVNLVRVSASGSVTLNSSGGTGTTLSFQVYRATGTTAIGGLGQGMRFATGAVSSGNVNILAYDAPSTTSSTQYGLYGTLAAANNVGCLFLDDSTGSSPGSTGTLLLEEIMA